MGIEDAAGVDGGDEHALVRLGGVGRAQRGEMLAEDGRERRVVRVDVPVRRFWGAIVWHGTILAGARGAGPNPSRHQTEKVACCSLCCSSWLSLLGCWRLPCFAKSQIGK